MNKTLRNKILRNSTRLIECEYGKDTWNSNAYIAVKADIFSDYKLKKDQYIAETRPKLEFIINNGHHYEKVDLLERVGGDIETIELVSLKNDGVTVVIQAIFYDFIMSLFKGAKLFVSVDVTRGHEAPVIIMQNNEVVALICPLSK